MINSNYIKGKGRYWYKKGSLKIPYDKCTCGNYKTAKSKMCKDCAGLNDDGTFKQKNAKDKKFKCNGYCYIYSPSHPRAHKTGYVMEHILLAEKKLGRPLKKEECVHHKNHKRDDNRLENLLVVPKKIHNMIHNPRTNALRQGNKRNNTLDYCDCGRLKKKEAKMCRFCFKTHKIRKQIESANIAISAYFNIPSRRK
jgi:hypothetical protein